MTDSALSDVPRISVLTPSLNHGRFLVDTIESILRQSYRQFEHIVVDGGSSDETLDILKRYPHIRWISEKEKAGDPLLVAYRKALAMARGDFIIQCCVSDGFLYQDWFKRCVEVLDGDKEVSLVWGLPQYISEDNAMGRVSFSEFFDDPPPQKTEFLSFWLASGFFLPEGNYCIRKGVFDACLPQVESDSPFKQHHALGFNYNFNTSGFLPYFLPIIANYGRTHEGQRGQRLSHIEKPLEALYRQMIYGFRSRLFGKAERLAYRNGFSEVIREVSPWELRTIRRKVLYHRLMRSRLARLSLSAVLSKARRALDPVSPMSH